ncbi:MAG TPA: c-type cytochrome [Steroidobacteraceae bacterium]|nr:c-type cytochrome [Steroidobacteraceae bacterium]
MTKFKFSPGIHALSLAAIVSGMAAVVALSLLLNPQARAQDAIVPDEEAGAEVYSSVCKGCHGVSIAPTLRGILKRPIASIQSFGGYSAGLKAKQGETWTEANLNAFLTSPTEFAPGTLMTQTIPEAQRRADVIAYLASLPPPRE